MTSTTKNDRLQAAIAALGAIEVAPERWAKQLATGRWITSSFETMAILLDDPDCYNVLRTSESVALMPAWWTPERQFAIRANQGRDIHGTFQSKGLAEYCSLVGPIITANLETGEEVPC